MKIIKKTKGEPVFGWRSNDHEEIEIENINYRRFDDTGKGAWFQDGMRVGYYLTVKNNMYWKAEKEIKLETIYQKHIRRKKLKRIMKKEKYYRCNKCGGMIAKESSKPDICTSDLIPVRVICGGSFTIELTKDEVIEQFKEWKYSKDDIDDYFKS